MKWPETLTVVRHSQSEYNILKQQKQADPEYSEFREAYEQRKEDPEYARKLAQKLLANGKHVLGVGDHNTPITDEGAEQAVVTGERLKDRIKLPDVILVSPYERTRRTLGQMAIGWPELADVKTVEEERIREQEHGTALLYNDWRIFHVLHPEQERLRELEGSYWYRFPQGENVPDVRERNRSVIGTITRDYSEQNVMMMTHHLNILSLRANLERLDAQQFAELDEHETPVNCGVTIYRGNPNAGQDGHLELDIYNQQLY